MLILLLPTVIKYQFLIVGNNLNKLAESLKNGKRG